MKHTSERFGSKTKKLAPALALAAAITACGNDTRSKLFFELRWDGTNVSCASILNERYPLPFEPSTYCPEKNPSKTALIQGFGDKQDEIRQAIMEALQCAFHPITNITVGDKSPAPDAAMRIVPIYIGGEARLKGNGHIGGVTVLNLRREPVVIFITITASSTTSGTVDHTPEYITIKAAHEIDHATGQIEHTPPDSPERSFMTAEIRPTDIPWRITSAEADRLIADWAMPGPDNATNSRSEKRRKMVGIDEPTVCGPFINRLRDLRKR